MKSRQPTQAELIDRLATQLGADVAISLRDLPVADRRIQRRANASLVSDWRNAVQYIYSEDARLNVIWPTVPSDKDFALMRRRLVAMAGIWDTHCNHLWLLPEERTRFPSPDETARYLPWFMHGLEATGVRPTLLLGSRAVWAWRPDLKPQEVNGKTFVWRDSWVVYPMLHPMNVARQDETLWEDGLARLRALLTTDDLLWWLGDKCIKCGSPIYMFDPDGVPWCREHIQAGLKSQREGAGKWATLTIHATSGELFQAGEYSKTTSDNSNATPPSG